MHDKRRETPAAAGNGPPQGRAGEPVRSVDRRWTASDIPSQHGRLAVVTGADAGLGLEVTKKLVRHGRAVVMAGNAIERANAVAAELRAATPGASISVELVDLGDLDSVRAFASRFNAEYGALDLLVNNAGIMFPPLTMTKDGFEGHFGVNYLGHFALTGLLLRPILSAPASRTVTVASNAHKMGSIDFDNLRAEKGYGPMAAYAQSKLANLVFSRALSRRLGQAGSSALAVAAHPGQSATHWGGRFSWAKLFEKVISQSPQMGALPILRAATDPGARADDYFGPGGFLEMRGHPVRVDRKPHARDDELADRLWEVSESLTGVRYDFADPAAP